MEIFTYSALCWRSIKKSKLCCKRWNQNDTTLQMRQSVLSVASYGGGLKIINTSNRNMRGIRHSKCQLYFCEVNSEVTSLEEVKKNL